MTSAKNGKIGFLLSTWTPGKKPPWKDIVVFFILAAEEFFLDERIGTALVIRSTLAVDPGFLPPLDKGSCSAYRLSFRVRAWIRASRR